MSHEDNKALVRRYYEDVVNTGNVDEIARFIAPGYVEVHDNRTFAIGLQSIVEHGGAANFLGPLLEIGAIEVVRDEGE